MEEFQIIDHYLMVKLPVEVDHHKSQYLCQKADELLLCREVKNIVFDFEDTVFMDSSGVGIIMGRYRKVTCIGGKIYIIHANQQIKRIIKVSGMSKYVCVLDNQKGEEILK